MQPSCLHHLHPMLHLHPPQKRQKKKTTEYINNVVDEIYQIIKISGNFRFDSATINELLQKRIRSRTFYQQIQERYEDKVRIVHGRGKQPILLYGVNQVNICMIEIIEIYHAFFFFLILINCSIIFFLMKIDQLKRYLGFFFFLFSES